MKSYDKTLKKMTQVINPFNFYSHSPNIIPTIMIPSHCVLMAKVVTTPNAVPKYGYDHAKKKLLNPFKAMLVDTYPSG